MGIDDVLGTQLRLLRESTGVKQGDLAKAVGISQAALSRMEAGRQFAKLERWRVCFESLGFVFNFTIQKKAVKNGGTK